MGKTILWVAGGILALVVTGCGTHTSKDASAAATRPTTFIVKGDLTLMGGVETNYGSCFSTEEGYSDIDEGAQVTVYDASGKAIALGSLESGVPPKAHYLRSIECVYRFTVKDVPISSGPIYAVEVTHRGQIKFTQKDASHLSLTLGS